MGFWKGVGKVAVSATILTAKGTIGVAKIAGKGAARAGKAAFDHRQQIGKVVSTTAKGAGATVAVVGYGTYKAAEWTTKKVVEHRREIGGAAIGVAKGLGNATADAAAHVYASGSAADLLLNRLNAQSAEYRCLASRTYVRLGTTSSTVRRRDVALDSLAVGGNTLASYASFRSPVPPEVERAYQLAYPDLAARHSFVEEVRYLDNSQMEGFVSGVKGKLFEIEYVDYLNAGQLPSGYHAALANSANQPGWDIAILGPDGHLKDVIQAKATESLGYVKEALDRYPNIDVVTTDEVYSQLLMAGYGDHVTASGITEHALHGAVQSATDAAATHFSFAPSIISLAVIAFSSYTQEGLDEYQRSKNFGERSTRSYLAYLAGGVVAVATGTWWIGVIGGVGSRLLLGRGRTKREQLRALKELVQANDRVLHRLRDQAAK